MAKLLELQTFSDNRGHLTVMDNIETLLPFKVKRIFYIYGVNDSDRGGHRHHKTRQAAICLQGVCTIYNNNGYSESEYRLDDPKKCLILETEDWHIMTQFSQDAVLLVFASEAYDPDDYIMDPYPQ